MGNMTPHDMKDLLEHVQQTGEHANIVVLSPDEEIRAPLLIVPNGKHVVAVKEHLDAYRERPERREGTARITDLTSFIEHVYRFKDADSAVFVKDTMPDASMTAVLDYHERENAAEGEEPPGGRPRWGKHRSHYAFPVSDEWKAWAGRNGPQGKMGQKDFAEFIEDRIGDVIAPPDFTHAEFDGNQADLDLQKLADLLGSGGFAGQTRLLELSRGMSISVNERAKQITNLSSGEAQILWETTHSTESGGPLKVPGLFLIGIPVFRNGPIYRIAVRLRYRLNEGRLHWFYEMYRVDKVWLHAMTEAVERVRAETGLPVFFGAPE